MIVKQMDIHYLGNRDYIDVSTLSSSLYKALPDITDNPKIKNLKIRVLKKVIYNCDLLLLEEGETPPPKSGSSVIFNWQYENKNYTAYFRDTKDLITKREPEVMTEPEKHMRYENGEVKIFDPVNDDCIYNLMKMGRIIVVKKYNLFPRVVNFHFDRLYNKNEMKGIIMKAEYYAPKEFYRLTTYKDNLQFGEIIVKGLAPY